MLDLRRGKYYRTYFCNSVIHNTYFISNMSVISVIKKVLVLANFSIKVTGILPEKNCPKFRDSIFYQGFKPRDRIFPAVFKENSISFVID